MELWCNISFYASIILLYINAIFGRKQALRSSDVMGKKSSYYFCSIVSAVTQDIDFALMCSGFFVLFSIISPLLSN